MLLVALIPEIDASFENSAFVPGSDVKGLCLQDEGPVRSFGGRVRVPKASRRGSSHTAPQAFIYAVCLSTHRFDGRQQQ